METSRGMTVVLRMKSEGQDTWCLKVATDMVVPSPWRQDAARGSPQRYVRTQAEDPWLNTRSEYEPVVLLQCRTITRECRQGFTARTQDLWLVVRLDSDAASMYFQLSRIRCEAIPNACSAKSPASTWTPLSCSAPIKSCCPMSQNALGCWRAGCISAIKRSCMLVSQKAS